LHGGEPIVDARLTDNPAYPVANFSIGQQVSEYNTGYMSVGWGGQSGGWAYHCWAVPLTFTGLQTPVSQYMQWWYGGDNHPASIADQPNASTVGAERPTYKSLGLSAEIAFHKVIAATESEYPLNNAENR